MPHAKRAATLGTTCGLVVGLGVDPADPHGSVLWLVLAAADSPMMHHPSTARRGSAQPAIIIAAHFAWYNRRVRLHSMTILFIGWTGCISSQEPVDSRVRPDMAEDSSDRSDSRAGVDLSLEDQSSPRMVWKQEASNPVLFSNKQSKWMQLIGDPTVLLDGATFKMWFAANVVDGITEVAYATSADGVVWDVHPKPVLKVSSDGTWDAITVETPTVIKNTDGTYEMWYSGAAVLPDHPDAIPDALYKVGHAISADGIVWTKDPANPVLDINLEAQYLPEQQRPPDWASVADPHVIRKGSTYRMWYTCVTTRGEEMLLQICLATSSDGSHWQRHEGNPVIALEGGRWDSGMVAQPAVVFDGTRYLMAYAGKEGSGEPAETGDIGSALSTDGIIWQREVSPIVRKGAAGLWSDLGVWGPTLVHDASRYHLWFGGIKTNITTGFGKATGWWEQ